MLPYNLTETYSVVLSEAPCRDMLLYQNCRPLVQEVVEKVGAAVLFSILPKAVKILAEWTSVQFKIKFSPKNHNNLGFHDLKSLRERIENHIADYYRDPIANGDDLENIQELERRLRTVDQGGEAGKQILNGWEQKIRNEKLQGSVNAIRDACVENYQLAHQRFRDIQSVINGGFKRCLVNITGAFSWG